MVSAFGVAERASSKQTSSNQHVSVTTKKTSTAGSRLPPSSMYTTKNFIGKVTATDTIVDTLFILGPSSEGQALIVNMAEQLS